MVSVGGLFGSPGIVIIYGESFNKWRYMNGERYNEIWHSKFITTMHCFIMYNLKTKLWFLCTFEIYFLLEYDMFYGYTYLKIFIYLFNTIYCNCLYSNLTLWRIICILEFLVTNIFVWGCELHFHIYIFLLFLFGVFQLNVLFIWYAPEYFVKLKGILYCIH